MIIIGFDVSTRIEHQLKSSMHETKCKDGTLAGLRALISRVKQMITVLGDNILFTKAGSFG